MTSLVHPDDLKKREERDRQIHLQCLLNEKHGTKCNIIEHAQTLKTFIDKALSDMFVEEAVYDMTEGISIFARRIQAKGKLWTLEDKAAICIALFVIEKSIKAWKQYLETPGNRPSSQVLDAIDICNKGYRLLKDREPRFVYGYLRWFVE